jgi:hypothetical protein
MKPIIKEPIINSINLEKLTYYVSTRLRDEGFNGNCTIDYEKMHADEILCHLKYELARQANIKVIDKWFRQDLKQTVSFYTNHPKSIWQMFKQKYMPKFFTRRYPVQFTKCTKNIDLNLPVNFKVEVGMDVVYPDVVLPKNSYTTNFRFMNGHNFTTSRINCDV